METVIDRLAGAAGHYTGGGDGAESGPFAATMDVRPLLDGLGVEIAYTAIDPQGDRLHDERTTLAFEMMTGEPTLYVLCAELHGIARLRQIAPDVFSNSAGKAGFELQIELGLGDDGELTYVWSWAPPEEDIMERSRAVLRLAP